MVLGNPSSELASAYIDVDDQETWPDPVMVAVREIAEKVRREKLVDVPVEPADDEAFRLLLAQHPFAHSTLPGYYRTRPRASVRRVSER